MCTLGIGCHDDAILHRDNPLLHHIVSIVSLSPAVQGVQQDLDKDPDPVQVHGLDFVFFFDQFLLDDAVGVIIPDLGLDQGRRRGVDVKAFLLFDVSSAWLKALWE